MVASLSPILVELASALLSAIRGVVGVIVDSSRSAGTGPQGAQRSGCAGLVFGSCAIRALAARDPLVEKKFTN